MRIFPNDAAIVRLAGAMVLGRRSMIPSLPG